MLPVVCAVVLLASQVPFAAPPAAKQPVTLATIPAKTKAAAREGGKGTFTMKLDGQPDIQGSFAYDAPNGDGFAKITSATATNNYPVPRALDTDRAYLYIKDGIPKDLNFSMYSLTGRISYVIRYGKSAEALTGDLLVKFKATGSGTITLTAP